MSFEKQADHLDLDRRNVRARVYCGKCGCHLQRFEVWPEIGDALPRIGGPSNPSRRHPESAYQDRNLPAVATAHPSARPPDMLHHYPCVCDCNCDADWKSGSYRLGAAILAKSKATGRTSVRLVTGVDV